MRQTGRLVDVAARLLEPAEREAVLGDIAESGSNGSRALRDVLGLVLRRQVAAWGDWRPWLTLFGIVLPLGVLLSVVSRFWSGSAVWTLRIYATHWGDWEYFSNPGLQRYVLGLTAATALKCVALACWSWACGAAIGTATRRTSWTHGALFVTVFIAGTIGTTTTGRLHPLNAERQSTFVYAVALPFFFRAMTVVVPAAHGFLRAHRGSLLFRRVFVLITSTIALTLLTRSDIQASLFFGWVRWPADNWRMSAAVLSGQWLPGPDGIVISADDVIGWKLQLLPFVMLVPVICLVAVRLKPDTTYRLSR